MAKPKPLPDNYVTVPIRVALPVELAAEVADINRTPLERGELIRGSPKITLKPYVVKNWKQPKVTLRLNEEEDAFIEGARGNLPRAAYLRFLLHADMRGDVYPRNPVAEKPNYEV